MGPSTRAVHAGLPPAEQGARATRPGQLEAALGQLEDAESVLFSSGMAAPCAVLARARRWVEPPANPALDVCDIAAAARAAGARLAVDNTLATPLGQRPLDLGADAAMCSATKSLSGHSDLILGAVSVRDREWAAVLRGAALAGGAIAGPFEAWLLHRSLSPRLERQSANALALARFLRGRPEISGVRHPGLPDDPGHGIAARQMVHAGPLVGFTLDGAERAQRFLAALELVAEATSFGGAHSTAERRARWATDDVPDGFIRFSAGCEDSEDLLADGAQALARS